MSDTRTTEEEARYLKMGILAGVFGIPQDAMAELNAALDTLTARLTAYEAVVKAVAEVPRRRDDSPELNTVRNNARALTNAERVRNGA